MHNYKSAGIISRQQAEVLWGPAIDRLEVSGELGDDASLVDAIAVMDGASSDEHDNLWELMAIYKTELPTPWQAKVQQVMETGNTAFVDLLQASNQRQQGQAQQARERARQEFVPFAELLGQSVIKLVQKGVLTQPQATVITERVLSDTGEPTFADMPVSMLEYHRLRDETQVTKTVPYTNFRTGTIISPTGTRYFDELKEMNKIHETTHAWLGGIEVEQHVSPESSVVAVASIGLWGFDRHNPDNQSIGFAANEGMASYLTTELYAIEPRLGHEMPECHGYQPLEDAVREWKDKDLGSFAVALEAFVVDATPQNPDAKQAALSALDEAMASSRHLPAAARALF